MNRQELEFAISDLGALADALISINEELRDGTPQWFLVRAGGELLHSLHQQMRAAFEECEDTETPAGPRVVSHCRVCCVRFLYKSFGIWRVRQESTLQQPA